MELDGVGGDAGRTDPVAEIRNLGHMELALPQLDADAENTWRVRETILGIESAQIVPSSMKARQKDRAGRSTESIMRWKAAGAFLRPNGMTVHWYSPRECRRTVLWRSSGATGTR